MDLISEWNGEISSEGRRKKNLTTPRLLLLQPEGQHRTEPVTEEEMWSSPKRGKVMGKRRKGISNFLTGQ